MKNVYVTDHDAGKIILDHSDGELKLVKLISNFFSSFGILKINYFIY